MSRAISTIQPLFEIPVKSLDMEGASELDLSVQLSIVSTFVPPLPHHETCPSHGSCYIPNIYFIHLCIYDCRIYFPCRGFVWVTPLPPFLSGIKVRRKAEVISGQPLCNRNNGTCSMNKYFSILQFMRNLYSYITRTSTKHLHRIC